MRREGVIYLTSRALSKLVVPRLISSIRGLRNARFWESHAVARHGRTAIAALRLNWSGLGRWISDQIRQQQIDEGLQFAASQRGVLSNLRY